MFQFLHLCFEKVRHCVFFSHEVLAPSSDKDNHKNDFRLLWKACVFIFIFLHSGLELSEVAVSEGGRVHQLWHWSLDSQTFAAWKSSPEGSWEYEHNMLACSSVVSCSFLCPTPNRLPASVCCPALSDTHPSATDLHCKQELLEPHHWV